MERTYDTEIYKRINHVLCTRTCVQMDHSEICNQKRANTFVKEHFFINSWRIKIALESYFEEHAKELWERTWMSPTCSPELIATILKALREQLKEKDQLNAVEQFADPSSEIPLETWNRTMGVLRARSENKV